MSSNQITFSEARSRVSETFGVETSPQGYEDATQFNVIAVFPEGQLPIDDLAIVVDKASGLVSKVVYLDHLEMFDAMKSV